MKEDFEVLAKRLRATPRDPNVLHAACDTIASGGGEELFRQLLHLVHQETSGSPRYVQTQSIMSVLERVMDANPAVGGYLMARLYPLAGAAKDHTTFNAIELWMDQTSSEELAVLLADLAKGGGRPRMRAKYQAWCDSIRQRIGDQ